MAIKDWKKTYEGKTLIRFENKNNGKRVFITPTDDSRLSGKWFLHLHDGRKIDYRGKLEVKRAMKSYMRSH